MITDISVVFRTRDESRRLHKLQLAIYSVKDDNTFRRISEIVIIPSMSRLVIDLTSGVSITFINLEPGQQMEISEGQTVGVQVNGDSGNGHPWLIGGTNSSFKISSGSIRDEVVRGNMRDLAQFPGMSFFVKRSEIVFHCMLVCICSMLVCVFTICLCVYLQYVCARTCICPSPAYMTCNATNQEYPFTHDLLKLALKDCMWYVCMHCMYCMYYVYCMYYMYCMYCMYVLHVHIVCTVCTYCIYVLYMHTVMFNIEVHLFSFFR